jgi:hypothetical protein
LNSRKRSDPIAIYVKHYESKEVFFPRFFGKEPIKSAEELSDKLEYDATLVRKRYGYFYLCIPKRPDKYNRPLQNKAIAFNPGIKTFCTGYDPDGIIVKVGKSNISKIYRLYYHYDKLQSKWSQPETNHRKRFRYKMQEQEFNVAFGIWLMNSTKKKKKKNDEMGLQKLQYYIPTLLCMPFCFIICL